MSSSKLINIAAISLFLCACDVGSKEIGMSPSDDLLDQNIFAYLLDESGIAFRRDRRGYFYVNGAMAGKAEKLMRDASSESGRRIGLIPTSRCEREGLEKLLDSLPLPYAVKSGEQVEVWIRGSDADKYQINGRFALISDHCSHG